jgi:N-acetylglutamate synthase-like GNAT family acetyltransferase
MNFRKLEMNDRNWVDEFIRNHWGSKQIIIHNKIYFPGDLDGFVAENNEEKYGLITYQIQKHSCEIVTLNSTIEHHGFGRDLVKLVIEDAKLKGCEIVRVVTTNDNIRAIEFYQKLDFQLIMVYPDAVNNSRTIKPEIPLTGENGIPIRDELEFVLQLSTILPGDV